MRIGFTVAAIICFVLAAIPRIEYTGQLTNVGLALFAASHIVP